MGDGKPVKVVWELPKAEILRWSNNLVVGIAVLEGDGKPGKVVREPPEAAEKTNRRNLSAHPQTPRPRRETKESTNARIRNNSCATNAHLRKPHAHAENRAGRNNKPKIYKTRKNEPASEHLCFSSQSRSEGAGAYMGAPGPSRSLIPTHNF